MKWLIYFMLCASCFAGSTNWLAQRTGLVSPYGNCFDDEQVPLGLLPNLVAWLPFPAPFVSTQRCFAVNYTNDFLITGATWTNTLGGGMSFGGASEYLTAISTASIKATNDATWVFLFKLRSFGGSSGGRFAQTETLSAGYLINATSANDSRFYSDSSGTAVATPNGTIITNKTTLLAWTRSGTSVKAYTGGVQVVSGSIVSDIGANTSAMTISSPDVARYLDGTIYEFLYFNRALTSNEVFVLSTVILRRHGL